MSQPNQNSFETILKQARTLYFLGIGGIGMSALARIFKQLGYEVSGSDIEDSEIVADLISEGIPVFVGHTHQVEPVDVVVCSTAITKTHSERIQFETLNVPIIHRSDLLAYLMNHIFSIGVTGTHGKTTTSALIAFLTQELGLSPMALIGGYMKNYQSNALFGDGKLIVAEVDESDKTQLACRPKINVITNLEADHLEHYQDLEGIYQSFRQYLQQLDSDAVVIYYAEDAPLRQLILESEVKAISYGFQPEAQYYARHLEQKSGKMLFELWRGATCLGFVEMPLLGEHNVLNGLAAFAVMEVLGVTPKRTIEALPGFKGIQRRMDVLHQSDALTLIDDYAHHPTEILYVLQTLRKEAKRLVVLFEPHRYSRTKLLLKEFGSCFNLADILILTDIYAASELPIEGVGTEGLHEEVKQYFSGESYFIPKKQLLEFLAEKVRWGDTVVFLGAGEITQLAKKFHKSFDLNRISNL